MPSKPTDQEILVKLFGSKARVKVLTLLLANPERSYFVREITRRLSEQINSVRRELANLEKIGLVKSVNKNRKKFFQVNQSFVLFAELRNLLLKIGANPDDKLARQISSLGSIKLAVLTGAFTQNKDARTDLLLVGRADRKKLTRLLKQLEDDLSQEISYTVITPREFEYRRQMADRFLQSILNNDHLIVVDHMNRRLAVRDV